MGKLTRERLNRDDHAGGKSGLDVRALVAPRGRPDAV